MVLKRKITMVYPNYSGNYNEFRHIIADNEIRLAYLQFVNVPNFPLINKYPEILSIKYISSIIAVCSLSGQGSLNGGISQSLIYTYYPVSIKSSLYATYCFCVF